MSDGIKGVEFPLRLAMLSTVALAVVIVCPGSASGQSRTQEPAKTVPADSPNPAPQPSAPATATDIVPAQGDEIVVTGVRASLVGSQDAKRNATNIADFITQEEIGKYTDQNLAETLQRVPGVQIARGQSGEGTFVSIRGLGPNFVFSTINGRSAFGGAGGDAGLNNRNGFSLDSIAPEQTAGVEVFKSSSADQLEGGIGGVLNILTARPLDLKQKKGLYSDNLFIAASADATYSVEPKRVDPRISGLISWRNTADTFGVLASLSYYDRSTATQIASQITTNASDTIAGVPNVFRPGILNYEIDNGSIKRLGFGGTVQWRPSTHLETSFDVLGTRQKTERLQNSLRGFLPSSVSASIENANVQPVTASDFGGILLGGRFPVNPALGPDQPTGEDLGVNTVYDRKETSYGGHIKWAPGYGLLKINADAAYFKTDFARSEDLAGYGIQNLGGFDYFVNNSSGVSLFSFLPSPGSTTPFNVRAINLGTPSEFGFNRIFAGGDEQSYRLDVDYKTRIPFLAHIRAGLSYRVRQQDQVFNVLRYGQADLVSIAAASGVSTLFDVNANGTRLVSAPAGGFLSEVAGIPYNTWLGIDNRAIFGFYRPLIDAYLKARGTSVDQRGYNPALGFSFGPFGSGGFFTGREKILAGYVMSDIDGRLGNLPVRGNIGVRLVETRRSGLGFVTAPQIDPATGNTIARDAAGNPITSTNATNDTGKNFRALPSLNLTFEVRPNFLLRVAASKVVSQPDLPSVAGPTNVSFVTTATGTITQINIARANPDLKPFEAKQYDLIAEWYPGSTGAFVAAGAFLKDIKNLVTNSTLAATEFVVNGVTYRATAGTSLQVSQPINGEGGAKVSGIEVQGHLPLTVFTVNPFIRNFGIQGTFTRLLSNRTAQRDAITGSALPFPDASKTNYSVTGYYDDGRFSSRVSYTYRSRSYTGIGFLGSGLYNEPYGALDTNFDLKLSKNFALRVQALNLLESATQQSTAGGRLPYLYSQNGRLFILGGRVQF